MKESKALKVSKLLELKALNVQKFNSALKGYKVIADSGK